MVMMISSSRIPVIGAILGLLWWGTLCRLLTDMTMHQQNTNNNQNHYSRSIMSQLKMFVIKTTTGDNNANKRGHRPSSEVATRTAPVASQPHNDLGPNWVELPPDFDPSTHNETVPLLLGFENTTANSLPGLFWQDRLWLLGARLTTVCDDDESIYLTIFGMPGDFHNRSKSRRIRCPATDWYNGRNGTILSYPETRRRVRLFASLSEPPNQLYPLEFIPSISADFNQNNVTLIWHGDLQRAESLSKMHTTSIQQARKLEQEGTTRMALRVTIHASFEHAHDTATPIMTVDIPLSTGVVGQAGPQVMAVANDEQAALATTKTRSRNNNTESVTLCVAIYGDDSVRFLPEFVLHHLNMGFGPIVVGVVDATIGSEKINTMKTLMNDLVQLGMVELSAMGLPTPINKEPLECEVNIRKQHFYNTCLYHAKGRTPYMGIWDIDEYWVPPPEETNATASATTATSTTHQHQSSDAAFSTVGQVMAEVQKYQESVGCGDAWCYHAFPSLYVWRRRHQHETHTKSQNNETTVTTTSVAWGKEFLPRTGRVLEDFELRNTEIDWDWSKSITRTKYAFMGGLHQTGSCRLTLDHQGSPFLSRQKIAWHDEPYEKSIIVGKEKKSVECRNKRMEGFGAIHHFASLNRVRSMERESFEELCMEEEKESKNAYCVADEYVQRFGSMVHQRMKARNRQLGLSD